MTARALIVSLTHGSAPLGRPARLRFSLYLSGTGLHAAGTLARDGTGFQDFRVSAAQIAELCRAAEEAGFPARLPKVEGRNDTSDRWAHVLLYLSIDGKAQTLDLPLLSSGFEGPDAPALRRFFQALLAVAGVQDDSIRFDLVGA